MVIDIKIIETIIDKLKGLFFFGVKCGRKIR